MVHASPPLPRRAARASAAPARGASPSRRLPLPRSSATPPGCAVDRETGVARVLDVAAAHDFGRVLNPVGAEGQVEGGVVHGIGHGVHRGNRRRRRQAGEPAPPRLQADDGGRRSADPDRVHRRAGSKRRAVRQQGRGGAARVPTAGAIGNAIAAATGARVHQLPMTPVRVWESLRMPELYAEPTTVDEALEALGQLGPDVGIVAGGTDLVVGARRGKKPLPDALVAIHRLAGLARDRGRVGLPASPRRAGHPCRRSRARASCGSGGPRSPTPAALVGSPATRHVGTIGGNLGNASPAMESGSPLIVFGASVEVAGPGGTPHRRRSTSCSSGRGRRRLAAGELITGVVRAGAARRLGQRVRPAGVPADDGDRRRRRRRARHARRRRRGARTPGSRSRPSRRHASTRRPSPRRCAGRSRRRRRSRTPPRRRARRLRADRRRPRHCRLPARDGAGDRRRALERAVERARASS